MICINKREFGKTKNGEVVTAFDIKNSNDTVVTVLDYGCVIQKIVLHDCNGNLVDVVLGYDDVASYENGKCYYGTIVGRYANRIKNARYSLDGKEYHLEKTNGEENHLHGVFPNRVFDSYVDGEEIVLKYISPDMEEGFPGNLTVEVRYHLCEDNSLEIKFKATTDAKTILNLTNHTCFNLNGQNGSTILDHQLMLNCGYFTECDELLGQTGKIIPVDNTPLDFRKEHIIGERINDDYYQLKICMGYDHNMIIDGKMGELKRIGTIKSNKTGICVEAFTTEPGVQFYSGIYIKDDPVPYGKNGVKYPKYGGFCLEAQHYPDSINHPDFPNTVLEPDEVYTQKTIYKFVVKK